MLTQIGNNIMIGIQRNEWPDGTCYDNQENLLIEMFGIISDERRLMEKEELNRG